jgi:hypothetical protein
MMEEWRQNIIYLFLSLVLLLLGGFLDWLHYKYPEKMTPKVKPKTKANQEKVRPEKKKPDGIKKRWRALFPCATKKSKSPVSEPKPASDSASREEAGGSTGPDRPCPRCGGTYRNFHDGFIFVKNLDGGLGELFRCGLCGKYWDRDVVYDKSRELDSETARRILSNGIDAGDG